MPSLPSLPSLPSSWFRPRRPRMSLKAYSRGWTALAAVAVLAGCALAPLTIAPASLVVVAFLGAALTLMMVVLLANGNGAGAGLVSRHGVAPMVAVGAIVLVAGLGLAGVSGVAGWSIVVVLGATSPLVVRRLWPATQGERTVADLSTPAIVFAWQSTSELLRGTTDPETTAALVAIRQEYLDELEVRDRAGVRRWLDAGAPAAGDPFRLLHDDDDGRWLRDAS